MTSPTLKPLNILIVDDETSSVISVAYVLRRGGHSVDTVSDGSEAYECLKENPLHYHILITDHAMMEVSGLELMLRLRSTGFHGKIMVLSANLTQDLRDTYTSLGANCFIAKPFDLAELRKAVDDMGVVVGQ